MNAGRYGFRASREGIEEMQLELRLLEEDGDIYAPRFWIIQTKGPHDTNLGVFSLDPKDSCTVGIPECSPPQDHSEQHLPQISIPQEGLQSYLLRVYLKTLQIRRHRMGPNTNTNTPPTTAAADCVQVPDSTRCSPARGEPSRHRRGTLGPFRGHGGASVAFVRDR